MYSFTETPNESTFYSQKSRSYDSTLDQSRNWDLPNIEAGLVPTGLDYPCPVHGQRSTCFISSLPLDCNPTKEKNQNTHPCMVTELTEEFPLFSFEPYLSHQQSTSFPFIPASWNSSPQSMTGLNYA